jgi:hypothetical protein
MGHRTLKRVPLDFNAPIGQIWEGYVNPFPAPTPCAACDRSGQNPATKAIADAWYGFHNGSVWTDAIEAKRLVSEGWTPVKYEDFGQVLLYSPERWCHRLTQDEV